VRVLGQQPQDSPQLIDRHNYLPAEDGGGVDSAPLAYEFRGTHYRALGRVRPGVRRQPRLLALGPQHHISTLGVASLVAVRARVMIPYGVFTLNSCGDFARLLVNSFVQHLPSRLCSCIVTLGCCLNPCSATRRWAQSSTMSPASCPERTRAAVTAFPEGHMSRSESMQQIIRSL